MRAQGATTRVAPTRVRLANGSRMDPSPLGEGWLRQRPRGLWSRMSRRGNRTALILLGIPKLVRFHKIRPQQLLYGILLPYPTAAGALPSCDAPMPRPPPRL